MYKDIVRIPVIETRTRTKLRTYSRAPIYQKNTRIMLSLSKILKRKKKVMLVAYDVVITIARTWNRWLVSLVEQINLEYRGRCLLQVSYP